MILTRILFYSALIIIIYLCIRAWRNGHRKIVWAIPFAYFLPVAMMFEFLSSYKEIRYFMAWPIIIPLFIIIWIKTKKPQVTSIKCPKCGAPSIVKFKKILNIETGKKAPSHFIGTISYIGVLFCIVPFFIINDIRTLATSLFLGGYLFSIGIAAFKPTIHKTEYECIECKNIFLQENYFQTH